MLHCANAVLSERFRMPAGSNGREEVVGKRGGSTGWRGCARREEDERGVAGKDRVVGAAVEDETFRLGNLENERNTTR